MIQLRPYQEEAIDATIEYWRNGGGNPLVDMATGTGKSAVIASLVRRIFDMEAGARVLMLVHVRELVQQNAQQLLRLWPGAPMGVNSAGLGVRHVRHPIIYASIQSVFKYAHSLGRRDLVIIDEAHLVPQSGEGMYQRLLADMRKINPDVQVFGSTATPYRLGSGRLDRGEGRLFDKIVYSYGIAEGIRDGYLAPLISKGMSTEIDVSGVAKRGGEFIAGALEAAADQDPITRAAVSEIISFGQGRKTWLVFATSVKHAFHLRDAFRERGISCEAVSGETPKEERDAILAGLKAGRIRCVTNCQVLTTGFDAPGIDLLAMLRPTLSTSLYVQMVGRGTRPIYAPAFNLNELEGRLAAIAASVKPNCLVLDFAGNVRRHGPVDDIQVSGRRSTTAATHDEDLVAAKVTDVRAKECPKCQALLALQAKTCANCGHEFNVTPQHHAQADTTPILSGKASPFDWQPVTSVFFYRHEKKGGDAKTPPSLKVTYVCGLRSFSEWFCFEHPLGSFPQRKAAQFWRQCQGEHPIPETVDEALRRQNEIGPIDAIRVAEDPQGNKRVIAWRLAPKQIGLLGFNEQGRKAG